MNFAETKISLPDSFKRKLESYEWDEISVGCSESEVFRLSRRHHHTLYLKISPNDSFPPLVQEKERLTWLKEKLSVPQTLLFSVHKSKSYLLTKEISGISAHEAAFRGNERRFIRRLTDGLQQIHSVPIENCPFDMRLDSKIRLAEERVKKGLVDESDFDEERSGRTAENLFIELLQTRPNDEDLVFTHGDYCLPNIIFDNGRLNGFVDLGNAGIADKYQDISLLARSIKYNLGAEWTSVLFENLGIRPDARKIRFYTLLDEFF